MRGGSREGSGRKATGRTSGVISMRTGQEIGELYGQLTAAQKRSLNVLVSSMVQARTSRSRPEYPDATQAEVFDALRDIDSAALALRLALEKSPKRGHLGARLGRLLHNLQGIARKVSRAKGMVPKARKTRKGKVTP